MPKLGSHNAKTLEWPPGFRQCRKCGELKPFSAFHKHKQCLYGINTVCKSCRKPLSTTHWQRTSEEYKIWSRAKSRANEKNLEFNIELEDITIPAVCPILKLPFVKDNIDYTYSIDRIDPNKGYIKGNIMIICNKANRIKSNATADEVMAVALYMQNNQQCEI